jgi:hypothetical protein
MRVSQYPSTPTSIGPGPDGPLRTSISWHASIMPPPTTATRQVPTVGLSTTPMSPYGGPPVFVSASVVTAPPFFCARISAVARKAPSDDTRMRIGPRACGRRGELKIGTSSESMHSFGWNRSAGSACGGGGTSSPKSGISASQIG